MAEKSRETFLEWLLKKDDPLGWLIVEATIEEIRMDGEKDDEY